MGKDSGGKIAVGKDAGGKVEGGKVAGGEVDGCDRPGGAGPEGVVCKVRGAVFLGDRLTVTLERGGVRLRADVLPESMIEAGIEVRVSKAPAAVPVV